MAVVRNRFGQLADSRPEDAGFTLIEMIVAIALTAVAFTALAALLAGSLRALSVSKARTQGNEIATQGIEDLQRLAYDDLGVCPSNPAAWSASAPSGLTDTVTLPECSGANPKFSPCATTAPVSGAVPAETYTCPRLNITFNVKRYVAYGDVGHTEKRLAVFVNWNDNAGPHTVSQQSSLRIPSQAALVGLAPPRVTSVTVAPTTIPLDASGHIGNDIAFTVQTTGLTNPGSSGDSVVVGFSTLDGGQPSQQTLALTSGDGTNWHGSILMTDNHVFGNGRQAPVVTAIRKSDGKIGSATYLPQPAPYTGALTFGTVQPHFDTPTASPATLHVKATGDLDAVQNNSFTLTVHSTNLSPTDNVTAVFDTYTGAVAIAMQPDAFTCSVSPGTCVTTWRATVSANAGYHLRTGTMTVYFRGIQSVVPTSVDVGDTDAASASMTVVSP